MRRRKISTAFVAKGNVTFLSTSFPRGQLLRGSRSRGAAHIDVVHTGKREPLIYRDESVAGVFQFKAESSALPMARSLSLRLSSVGTSAFSTSVLNLG